MRPITLSSTLLKSFSQLILGRAAWAVEQGRQSVELVLLRRRLARASHDRDTNVHRQDGHTESFCLHLSGSNGTTGSGRCWRDRTHAVRGQGLGHATTCRAGHHILPRRTFSLEQTNGVRQRSPDSPIAFGRVVSKDLESAILAARCCKPTNGNPPPEDGGSYMDDTYIWSMSRTHLQRMLDELCGRLSPCGLQVHPRKTEIIANMAGGEEFRVSGSRVKSKGLEHIIPVLGSPLSFRGEPAMLMAEMQKRGRQAFWAHRGIFLADAPLKKKTAEPCHIGSPSGLVGMSNMASHRVCPEMCKHATSHASPRHAATEAGENRAVARLAQAKSSHGTTTDPPMQDRQVVELHSRPDLVPIWTCSTGGPRNSCNVVLAGDAMVAHSTDHPGVMGRRAPCTTVQSHAGHRTTHCGYCWT